MSLKDILKTSLEDMYEDMYENVLTRRSEDVFSKPSRPVF